jgi:hypothetical protein
VRDEGSQRDYMGRDYEDIHGVLSDCVMMRRSPSRRLYSHLTFWSHLGERFISPQGRNVAAGL